MIYGKGSENSKKIGLDIATFLLGCKEKPIFICIGSDKVVGDSLGVIVGELLRQKPQFKNRVYGDMSNPINRSNLKTVLKDIRSKHPFSPIIVIDAVLGNIEEVGCIKAFSGGVIAGGQFGNGEMVGDYSIVGVVCPKGVSALAFLGCVRMNLVVELSKKIVDGICASAKLCLAMT